MLILFNLKHYTSKMQSIDINLWLVGDILLKADRMSMLNSICLRSPFLDKRVFDVARKLPTKLKISLTNTKCAFRIAASKSIPKQISIRPKLGFPVPIRFWLKEKKYYDIVNKSFRSATARKFFNTEKLCEILSKHHNGKLDFSRKIWTVYSFIIWYNEYFK